MTGPAPEPQPQTACGGTVAEPSCYPSEIFEGRVVLFCTEACWLAYLRDPERFMAGEIEHPE